jgi:hypothetical protein
MSERMTYERQAEIDAMEIEYEDRAVVAELSAALKAERSRVAELEAERDAWANTGRWADNQRLAAEAKVAELEARLSKDAEWNPPWSAAPDRAVGWKIGYSGNPYWVLKNGRFLDAPKFGYSGAWEDSWRMRP